MTTATKEQIEMMEPDWTKGLDENFEQLKSSALAALKAAEERAEKAEALAYAPGRWKCAKCDFTLQQANLNAATGSVTARDQAGDKCPNCASPLWRISWKAEAEENMEMAEQQWLRAKMAEAERDTLRARVAELERALEQSRTEYEQMTWGEDSEYRDAGDRVQKIIDAALAKKEPSNEQA